MADIQYSEEPQWQSRATSTKRSLLYRLAFATRLVSTETQAEHLLIGVAVLLFVCALIFPFLMNGSHAKMPQSVINAAMKGPVSAPTHR